MGWTDPQWLAGQVSGLVALGLCILAFASKKDDRLFLILIGANIAFAAQFVFFESWVAAALTGLIVVRLMLVRRFKGSVPVMSAMLVATAIAAWLTWSGPLDTLPLLASVLGTLGMFLLHGIAMRWVLALAALTWTLNNFLIGSFGGTVAEAMITVTNLITIWRLHRDRVSRAVRNPQSRSVTDHGAELARQH